jgi:metal-sulfur cluster biosynthetic enzyme
MYAGDLFMLVSKKKLEEAAEGPVCTLTTEEAFDVLRVVIDPDLGLNIVDLGLIYDVAVKHDEGKVDVTMTLTTPACPYGPQLISEVEYVMRSQSGVKDAAVEIVWDPPWSMDRISPEMRLELGLDI